MADAHLTPAAPKDLAAAISYALRFNDRGKAHTKGLRDDPDYMAQWIAAHLARSLYVVLKKAPEPRPLNPFGQNNPGV
ncbi:hypothetical protein [Roseomonas populi]|uniref:Uncharacterized protein n=1 Tax=Roseomonas populi TaxID=3121582 RepID=A0ABT1X219_9PROT|nr:hypothetical protein [Roseomonas pecuniae]MCR0981774.1 hypothetical protein [Roseomonas pecuniae]